MSRRAWIAAAYAYCALHIVSWNFLLEGDGSGLGEYAFWLLFGLFFLPLNLIVGLICWVIWGTTSLFHARYMFGPVMDVAIVSLGLTSAVVGSVVGWQAIRSGLAEDARRSRRRLH